ncbi:MAG: hypothetical protein LBV48_02375 [Mycoplasmataceae bacterium]|jgi:uncharacterized protein YneF (UPF0154 family)|nr:hypothetical protein [Mycoplasmataceae bacterium]
MTTIIEIILLIVFSIIAIVVGFTFTYFILLAKGKKMMKEQTGFDYEQAKSMYITYRQKNPNENQIKAMVNAFKNNK